MYEYEFCYLANEAADCVTTRASAANFGAAMLDIARSAEDGATLLVFDAHNDVRALYVYSAEEGCFVLSMGMGARHRALVLGDLGDTACNAVAVDDAEDDWPEWLSDDFDSDEDEIIV